MSFSNSSGAPSDPRVSRAVAYMESRLAHPLTVADLAATVHLSPYHFLRLFKSNVGRTPHRHLRMLRIHRAEVLLQQGLTVAAVAGRCGYSSTAHFSAAFLRETGQRPSICRDAFHAAAKSGALRDHDEASVRA